MAMVFNRTRVDCLPLMSDLAPHARFHARAASDPLAEFFESAAQSSQDKAMAVAALAAAQPLVDS